MSIKNDNNGYVSPAVGHIRMESGETILTISTGTTESYTDGSDYSDYFEED